MTVSLIVPVLNEVGVLPDLMAHLLPLVRQGVEVLLVDGGSDDGTASVAEFAGFRVLRSGRGRASQMNAGAAFAGGDVLLFLHADTRLPAGALRQVESALRHAHGWGRFDVCISGQHGMLRVIACLMNWRSRLTAIATGDQAIFMTRQAFESVGGFPEQALMEDVEISKRLRKISRPVCLSAKVITSGRRWESRGVWTTILLMWRLRWAYWRGVPASRLAQTYR